MKKHLKDILKKVKEKVIQIKIPDCAKISADSQVKSV
jgi:hypothetical protein